MSTMVSARQTVGLSTPVKPEVGDLLAHSRETGPRCKFTMSVFLAIPVRAQATRKRHSHVLSETQEIDDKKTKKNVAFSLWTEQAEELDENHAT